MTWNLDISTAPRAGHLWLATKCKKVLRSYWVEKTKRSPEHWSGLGMTEAPVAWQPYVVPVHPHHMPPADLLPVSADTIPIIEDVGGGE